MPADILTLNAGSSSLKFGLFRDAAVRLSGGIDRIGEPDAPARLTVRNASGGALPTGDPGRIADHGTALARILAQITAFCPDAEIAAVGHRVVHGGTEFTGPAVIDAAVETGIERLAAFAPLHQPHSLAGIRAAREAFPEALPVACFDTAFHRTQSRIRDSFALPREWYARGLRRYGFHGLSYAHVAGRLAEISPAAHAGRAVVAHLGNGASLCALRGGQSVASTMGFTALDGLPMGTRSGQIDPGAVLYLMDVEGMSSGDVADLLYRHSGLLGISGLSNDMRVLEAAGTAEAEEAIAHFADRIRRGIADMAAAAGGIDALVFTAGIGEHSARIRRDVCSEMAWMGIAVDAARNDAHAPIISPTGAAVTVHVIPTDEEGVIARETAVLLGGVSKPNRQLH